MGIPAERNDKEVNFFDLNPIQRFGFDVKNLIKLRELTEESVASKAGISLEDLQKIEAGDLPVEEVSGRIEDLAKGLNVDNIALGRLLTSDLLE